MKKWLWFLVLPMLLFCCALWAKQVTWNRREEDFRRDLVAEATQGRTQPLVEVRRWDGAHDLPVLGQWKRKELEVALAEVHLMRSASSQSSLDQYRTAYNLFYETPANYCGITLYVHEDKADFTFFSPSNNKRWGSLELTPQSCRALKRLIWAKYGGKLLALHVPPNL